ncbi:MAG: 3-dehydroquinate synthase [bacterium]|nr:3-dehydroquinate synthase [bacterium]MDD5354184.1 3-dehydroquinate synthase [bacterium]MDD5756334.1 3-dehydroquinate synthase [bacterium]
MKTVKVNLKERSYKIAVGADLAKLGSAMSALGLGKKIMIVTNPKVGHWYLPPVEQSLKKAGFSVYCTVIPDGERYKSQESANNIYAKCLQYGLDRGGTILALGGGVIGDLAGFAAATFMRGINLVQVPTTLLAQVDSSVGGKVGINLPDGKNMVGAFYQPKLVYADLKTLRTLPSKEFAHGLAEVIKYGIIYDTSLFTYLEKNMGKLKKLDEAVLQKVISRCCAIKAEVVTLDEKEHNLRAILNFGHTIGHALEGITRYQKYKHGEAVALGMVGAVKIAESLELVDSSVGDRLRALLTKAGLPVVIKNIKISWANFLRFMQHDKKVLAGKIRFVLPVRIGQVKIVDTVPLPIIKEIVKSLSK